VTAAITIDEASDTGASALARWRADPASFIETVLYDPMTDMPFVLLPAERTFIRFAFMLGADGRPIYTEWLYSGPKKSGKTAFGGLLMLTVILLFGGRYGDAYAAANDAEQAQARVFEAIKRIIAASPLLRDMAIPLSDLITFPDTGSTVRVLATDAASAAGGAPVISCFDELWGYQSERGHRFWDEMVPVPIRPFSVRLTVTYAGFSGTSQLLENLYKRGMALPEVASDLRAGDGMLMFWTHDPIAPWQDERWLAEMRRSLRPNQFARMIENRFVTTESTFIDLAWWDACVDPEATPVFLDRTMSTWVGIDASTKRDSTAIVACTWDGNKVVMVAHHIFQPSADDPLDFEATVEATILNMKKRFRVREVRFDPYQMQAVAQRLLKKSVPMVEFPQSVPNLTEASSNLYELVKARGIVAYPDEAVRLAVQRSIAIETPRGWRIAKEKQSHKIDVVVALGMAALGAVHGGIGGRQPVVFSEETLAGISAYRCPGVPHRPRSPMRMANFAPQADDDTRPPRAWNPISVERLQQGYKREW
jgi:Phage Terminase